MPTARLKPIDRGAPASVVAGKFGGLSRFAMALGKSPSTVHRWLVKGHIDGRYHGEVLRAARLPGNLIPGASLDSLDFVDTRHEGGAPSAPPPRPPAGEAQAAIETSHSHFTRPAWAALRSAVPLTLDEADLARLRGANEPISLDEVEAIYLPLTRLINLHVGAARGLARVTDDFLGRPAARRPYVVAIAGSVAVGKSTTARVLRALLARWPDHPQVDLVTTDGFLLPNAVLAARGMAKRKGFPESYDVRRMISVLSDVRAGRRAEVPVYSHHDYDIVPGATQTIDRPDILIFEGLNVLQLGTGPAAPQTWFTASDFFDLSIYIDAAEIDIERWFQERFALLRRTSFRDPSAFFHALSLMPEAKAVQVAAEVWRTVNGVNLAENILPSRPRADVVIRKGPTHAVESLWLRRL